MIRHGVLPLARFNKCLYLNMELESIGRQHRIDDLFIRMVAHGPAVMTPPQTSPSIEPRRRIAQAIVVGGATLGVVVGLAALALWFHYGTAVFFETISAGISACF